MYRTILDFHCAKIHRMFEPMPFNRGEMKFFCFTAADRALERTFAR